MDYEVIRLIASECKECGHVYYPTRRICALCGPKSFDKMKRVELPSSGKITNFTTLHNPPAGFPSPLIIAVITLGKVKVLGQIMGNMEKLKVGGKVEVIRSQGVGIPYAFHLL